MSDVPPIQFATSHGARIAYQVIGDGGVPIVAIPPLAQNIEVAWEWPDIRAMFDRFASFSTFVHFDKLGTGSSDRSRGVNTVDARVDDVRAVMDAAGMDRAHFFVASEGGPLSLLFASAFPERVLSLVMIGSFPRPATGHMTDEERTEFDRRQRTYAALWGTPDSPVVPRFAPSLAENEAFRTWHQRYERLSATPESLVDLLALSADVDVTETLPHIEAPTLVIHRTGDLVVPVELGRELAETIPNATLFEQAGADHFGYAGDMDGWMDEVERFITGTVAPRPSPTGPKAVRVTTLGRFAVTVDGREVENAEWGSRRARQLLKRLVAARGWPVTRDELIEMLWPDDPDIHRLGARLSVQLSAVRRVLDGGIVADRQTVRLDTTAVTADLIDFFEASSDEQIAESYTGEFLPEDRYDDWSAPARDEARTRFVMAARRLGERALADRDWEAAVELGRRLVHSDRYDADAHSLVIRALAASGEEREAERALKAWNAVEAELGLPESTLRDMT